MPDPARKLQLTESNEPRRGFDRFAIEVAMRESGAIARLTPAEDKVHRVMLSRADPYGIAWPSLERLARDTGYGERACLEARKSLTRRGLLQPVAAPAKASPHAKAFALIAPASAESLTPEANTGSGAPCTHVHPPPERSFTRSKTPKQDKEAAARRSDFSAQGATEARSELFEKAPRDAAAADLLINKAGMSTKRAHGLVTQYRPTAQQIENILANAEARNQAYQAGETDRPVNNLPGFVRNAIQHGEYSLDQRVFDQRERAKAQAKRQERRAQAAAEAEKQKQAEAEKAQRCARARARFAELSDAERQRYYERIVADMPLAAAQKLHVDHPRIKDWTIDLIAEQDAR